MFQVKLSKLLAVLVGCDFADQNARNPKRLLRIERNAMVATDGYILVAAKFDGATQGTSLERERLPVSVSVTPEAFETLHLWAKRKNNAVDTVNLAVNQRLVSISNGTGDDTLQLSTDRVYSYPNWRSLVQTNALVDDQAGIYGLNPKLLRRLDAWDHVLLARRVADRNTMLVVPYDNTELEVMAMVAPVELTLDDYRTKMDDVAALWSTMNEPQAVGV